MRRDRLACRANQPLQVRELALAEIARPSLGEETLPVRPAQDRMVRRAWRVRRAKIGARGAIAGAVHLGRPVHSVMRAEQRVHRALRVNPATRCRAKQCQEMVGLGQMQGQVVPALAQIAPAAVVASAGAAGAVASHRAQARGHLPIAQAARARAGQSKSPGSRRPVLTGKGLTLVTFVTNLTA
jgi:hypothetical protein